MNVLMLHIFLLIAAERVAFATGYCATGDGEMLKLLPDELVRRINEKSLTKGCNEARLQSE